MDVVDVESAVMSTDDCLDPTDDKTDCWQISARIGFTNTPMYVTVNWDQASVFTIKTPERMFESMKESVCQSCLAVLRQRFGQSQHHTRLADVCVIITRLG